MHCTCSDLKQRGYYVKTSCPPCFSMEYTWSVCRDLVGGFFSTESQNYKEIKLSYQVLRVSCKRVLQSSACT